MVDAARAILEKDDSIESVDLAQGLNGWTMSVVPSQCAQGHRFLDTLSRLAKHALLQAAEQSKSVYVLGYHNAEEVAFARRPQGFTAQLGVMEVEDTKSMCWPMVKHGSCRHGENCSKDHPALVVPVRVFIEAACFTASRFVIPHWKQEIASFMMIITAILTRISCVEEAAALNTHSGDGWRIEMSIRAEDMSRKETFLTFAKNAFMEATQRSDYIRLLGTGAEPFITKSNGFVAMLGEMSDRSQACWDFYTQGCCWREASCSCRWQHPQCMMPVSVVLKPVNFASEAAVVQDDAQSQMDLVLGLLKGGN
jgi:hypothetical protein